MFTLPISFIDGALDIRPDNTLNLNGSTDLLRIVSSPSLDITGNITLSCWVNASSINSNSEFIARYQITGGGRSYRLGVNSSNKFIFSLSDDGTNETFITGSTDISVSNWFHVMGTYDGANMRLYVNGVEDATAVVYSAGINSSSINVAVGSLSGSSELSNLFDGNISLVLICDDVVSVSELYNSSYAPRFEDLSQAEEDKCVMALPLHQDNPAPYNDQSINNNNASIVGTPSLSTPAIDLLFESTMPAPYAAWSDKFTKTGNDIDSVGPDWGDDSITSSVSGGIGLSMLSQLNGSTQYFDVVDSSSISPTSEITLAAWIKINTVESNKGICGKFKSPDRSFLLWVDTSSKFNMLVSSDGSTDNRVASTINVQAAQWYFVVGRLEGTELSISVNAGAKDTTTHSGGIYDSPINLEIGAYAGGLEHIDASIGFVGLWDRPISDTELNNLYNNGTPVVYQTISDNIKNGLGAFWSLDNNSGSGQELDDLSGNGNNLSNIGATPFSDNSLNVDYTIDNRPLDGGGYMIFDSDDFLSYVNTISTINDLSIFFEIEAPASGAAGGVLFEYNDISNGGLVIKRSDPALESVSSAVLDGSTKYFTTPDDSSFDFSNGFSASAWVYIDPSISANGSIVGQFGDTGNRGWYLRVNSDRTVTLTISANGTNVTSGDILDGTTVLNASQWYHLSATYDKVNMKIYIDGSEEATKSRTSAVYNSTAFMGVGARATTGSEIPFHGGLAFPNVWTRGLSPSEITDDYNSGTPQEYSSKSAGIQTGLVMSANLSNWSGSTNSEVNDNSGNGNTLTNVGSTGYTGTGLNILSSSDGVTLSVDGNNAGFVDTVLTSAFDGTLNKLAFRISSDNTTDIFQNGRLDASGTWAGSSLIVNSNIYIGGQTVHFGTCDIHNIKIFIHPLTNAQLIEMTI